MQTKRGVMLIAMVGLIVSGVLSVQDSLADPASISYGVLHPQLPDGSIAPDIVPGSSATLVRADTGVTIIIHTSGLDPGAAYTVWWVIYNYPQYCATNPCTFGDLGNADVQGTILNATGKVIGNNRLGSFGAHLAEGDTSGLSLPVTFPGDAVGLVDARTAQILLGVRSHGLPIPGQVKEQISMFNGGCPPNACEDEQVTTVFVP
jgi:hypothetical protein